MSLAKELTVGTKPLGNVLPVVTLTVGWSHFLLLERPPLLLRVDVPKQ